MTIEIQACEFNGLRWDTDEFANGTHRAYCWWKVVDATPEILIETTGPTELVSLDALRVAILKTYKKPTNAAVKNDRGDQVLPGGKCR